MSPEEEAKLINDDHEIWKETVSQTNKIKSYRNNKSIIDVPSMQFDEQLDSLIYDFRATYKMNEFKYSTFSATRPLFINFKNRIPLCTSNEEYAKQWLTQINLRLLASRQQAVNDLKQHDPDSIKSMFSVRCVIMPIDVFEGDVDPEIRGIHYFGLVISHYNSERVDIIESSELCDQEYQDL